MNLKEARKKGTALLCEANIQEAEIDARLLLEWSSKTTLMDFLMNPERELSNQEEKQYLDAINRRAERIPLQHITGEQEFMGYLFCVNENVLIPRQDTEVLVEEGLKHLNAGKKVLDMCTGSGCIAISLEKMTEYQIEVTAVDVSSKALEVARKNAKRLETKTVFIESDLFQNINQKFDVIVSNPPYIPTKVIEGLEEEVRVHDPMLALDGKEDGLYFYRRIISEARQYLEQDGWLLFEIGHDQGVSVSECMKANGYQEVSVKKDLAGLDRVVLGRYTNLE